MAGIPSVAKKGFLVERPTTERQGVPEHAMLEPTDDGGYRLLLTLPDGEEWVVERLALEFVLQSVRDHLEHVQRYP